MFYENYACGSDRNYTGFCDKQVDSLIDRQSSEADPEKRRELVWEIERTLARDASRPIIFYTRAATCWHPRVRGLFSKSRVGTTTDARGRSGASDTKAGCADLLKNLRLR